MIDGAGSGGGETGGGEVNGGEVGCGAVGSGKIGCCDGFGGFNFGNGGGCCSFLMAPIIETCSRAGSFVIKLGKSMASKVSSAFSRAAASG